MSSSAEIDSKNHKNEQGSLDYSEPEFICIGKVHRPHGIQGEVVFNPTTDFPERIRRGKKLYIGEDHTPATVRSVRQKPPFLLLGLDGYTDETMAGSLRNTFLFVRTDELPKLPAGEYYFHQLIGLQVYSPEQEHIGVLKEILETGANDVYVVLLPDGKEELVPAVPEFIGDIDLEEKKITIRIPEWM